MVSLLCQDRPPEAKKLVFVIVSRPLVTIAPVWRTVAFASLRSCTRLGGVPERGRPGAQGGHSAAAWGMPDALIMYFDPSLFLLDPLGLS